jgi:hypothetical protein
MYDCDVVYNVANPGRGGSSSVGGGVRVDGDATLVCCVIEGNTCNGQVYGNYQDVVGYGGGIYAYAGDVTLRNCTINNNSALCYHCCYGSISRGYGGGVFMQDGKLLVANCKVATNIASASSYIYGGGVYVHSGAADIINCTIVKNNADGVFGAAGTVNAMNSILYWNYSDYRQIGGVTTVCYSDVQGWTNFECGNIAVNPNLRPDSLELLSISPCIDAGNPDPVFDDRCRPPSKGQVRNDMGAYGGPGACCWLDCGQCLQEGPPTIEVQPRNQITCVGSAATFCVLATGSEPLRYQWRFHGTNRQGAPVAIFGATANCYSRTNVQSSHAGYYSVVVSNAFGSVTSTTNLLTVTPVCIDINLYSGLTLLKGVPGLPYSIWYATNVDQSTWTKAVTVTQTVAGVFWLDPAPANHERRFYKTTQP